MAIAWALSPAAGSRLRSARPSPWGLFRQRLPAWEPAYPWTCVAAVRRPKLALCPLFRTATTAALESSAQGRIMRFSKDHEWVNLEGDMATVGITAYAADQLGDIVFAELPAAGK